jgi:protoheme IX farnesyltransferase
MFRAYYELAKPGIVYGNLFTAAVGFLFASRWHVPLVSILATLAGIGLVVASACVFNNYLDRDIDQAMARTRTRPLVTGAVSGSHALLYGAALGLLGFALLGMFVNLLTAGIALCGFVVYVCLYTPTKRRTPLSALIGSVSGAVPIIVGYTAVADRLTPATLILFLILVFWQMPHFYAIAIYRLEEYRAAGVPVLPLRRGIAATKRHIVAYILAFFAALCSLWYFGYTGLSYLLIAAVFGLVWLGMGMRGFGAPDDARWARRLFFSSLIVLVVSSISISVAGMLP